ncbi:uncharacterized protein LOC100678204 [Nasonia vitripennis]|uniref:Uncharacterized protein n=1 Tax=Nasonia vitripennis TaxID=7425 RepID=A0A7M7LNN0_NASVI|nr:uncharacterized protein LOC100678204 [Nasonia vitripennis]
MMLKKALTKSGRRILKAIKSISSSARLAKKLQEQQSQQAQPQQVPASWSQQTRLYDLDLDRLSVTSCSLPSLLDAKSLDTFVTYVAPEGFEYCCCCHCDERDENQRNENLENEMMR